MTALLLKAYAAWQMEARKKTEQPGFAALMKACSRTDPYKCILCGSRLRFIGAEASKAQPNYGLKGFTG